ncbi:MAG: hypothetical protein RSD88_06105 [Anaerovoracaceae bacterium]
MDYKFGVDIRKKIEEDVKEAVIDFQQRPEVTTKFGEPIIGYANMYSPIFDMLSDKNLCHHPKGIYRPGDTVVVHFVPYAPEITKSNIGGKAPSKLWQGSYHDSLMLTMRINGVIRDALDTVGRLSSCTNTPADWEEDLCREDWSHKLVAYVAGMGHFGPAGCLITEKGFAGRFGSIITDSHLSEKPQPMTEVELEALYHQLMREQRYEEEDGVTVSEEMIQACPGKAISQKGINRHKCQEYCKTISEHIPSPEVCGKCFYY